MHQPVHGFLIYGRVFFIHLSLMTYQQTIDYLYNHLPMFSRIGPPAFRHDLINIIKLCEELENPHKKFKSIHIAGTNGKGSVSHMTAAILQSAGYKTGLYTSPHLQDFRERIRINGEMICEESVVNFAERIKPLIEKIEPSFFEISVAMAFDYFAQNEIDIAVIEVGLGGRLDSTNIITPELSVITNIGMDHMNMLGDTPQKIAFEKAGIIKKGIPVVVGEVTTETLPVFESVATEKGSELFIASEKRKVMDWDWEKHMLKLEIAEEGKIDHKNYLLDLPGIYQAKNLLTVLEVCSLLQKSGWNITEKAIHQGLSHVKKLTGLHGRWEIIKDSPLVILDVAHNIDGMRELVRQAEVTEYRELHLILGMVKDKEVEKILEMLPKSAKYYFTKAQIPRAMSEDELAVKAAIAGLQGTSWSDVNDALHSALEIAHPDDLIIVCGSVFLVGEVRLPLR